MTGFPWLSTVVVVVVCASAAAANTTASEIVAKTFFICSFPFSVVAGNAGNPMVLIEPASQLFPETANKFSDTYQSVSRRKKNREEPTYEPVDYFDVPGVACREQILWTGLSKEDLL